MCRLSQDLVAMFCIQDEDTEEYTGEGEIRQRGGEKPRERAGEGERDKKRQ